MINENIKSPLQSRTMVVNGVLGLLAFISLFTPGAESLKGFIDSHASQIGIVWSVINILLRAITKDRISLSD
jgi:hypothetical protein